MNCRKVSRRLSAYIEDDLSSSDKARIEEHMQSCNSCRRRAADLKLIIEAAGQLDRVEPGPYFVNRVLCAINQNRSPREVLSSWRYRLTLSGVAFVVAAGMTFFVIGPPANVVVETETGSRPVRVNANTPGDTSFAVGEDSVLKGFPVPEEALRRDMALTGKTLPESLTTEPEVLPKHYVQPVNINKDKSDDKVF